MAKVLRKRRTREHVIADLSVHHVEGHVLRCGWVVERIVYDYGLDLEINTFDRSEQVHRNLRIAFALAAYHSDNNRYPAKLNDLAPKYLAAVPDDLFSGKPLIYRVTDKGYLFYSVGINGKDEEGRSLDDDPAGDDLPVRMPLPELKRAK